jgi:hypothetical protein
MTEPVVTSESHAGRGLSRKQRWALLALPIDGSWHPALGRPAARFLSLWTYHRQVVDMREAGGSTPRRPLREYRLTGHGQDYRAWLADSSPRRRSSAHRGVALV